MFQSVINLDVEGLRSYAERMRDGRSFIYHLAEGTDTDLVEEFRDVEAADALQAPLIAIHSTGLGREEFAGLAGSARRSCGPRSPTFYRDYRDTTDVATARAEGVRVCLGSDWGPSGSKNLLGELKVADLWNRTHLDSAFSDEDLCRMATAWGGEALGVAWATGSGASTPASWRTSWSPPGWTPTRTAT